MLATVAAGLFVSWNGPLLIPAATRLQGIFFWDLMVYLPRRLRLPGDRHADARRCSIASMPVSLRELGVAAAADRRGDRGRALCLGLSGGLSAALAQPVARPPRSAAAVAMVVPARVRRRARRGLARRGAGDSATTMAAAPFPDRDLILFVTFGVIVVTLVGQGLAAAARRALARLAARRRRRTPARAGCRDHGAARSAEGRARPRSSELCRRRRNPRRGAGDPARAATIIAPGSCRATPGRARRPRRRQRSCAPN